MLSITGAGEEATADSSVIVRAGRGLDAQRVVDAFAGAIDVFA